MPSYARVLRWFILALALASASIAAHAQDIEPRAFAHTPVGNKRHNFSAELAVVFDGYLAAMLSVADAGVKSPGL